MTSVFNSGPQTQVNTYTSGVQSEPDIATLADGSYVITWASADQDGSAYGIYFQHFAADGTPVGGETRANSTVANYQDQPHIAAFTDGGYVIIWTGNGPGDEAGLFAQLFASDGAAVGGEILVDTTVLSSQQSPAVAATADGFVVSWESYGQDAADSYGIFAQAFDRDGGKIGGEFGANLASAYDQFDTAITDLSDGSYITSWTENTGGASHIVVRHFSAAGAALSGEIAVTPVTGTIAYGARVEALPDGGFAVVWASTGTGYDILMRRYDASANPLGAATLVNSQTAGTQSTPDLVTLSEGSLMVTWQTPTSGGNSEIHGQRYDSLGHSMGPEVTISTSVGPNVHAVVTGTAGGGVAVAWEGHATPDILTRVYGNATSLSGPQTLFGTSDSDLLDGGGGGDHMYGGYGDDVYVVHSASDIVDENGGQGYDTVETYLSYTLGAGAEALILLGAAPLSGSGNNLDNVIEGNAGANALNGGDGNDTIEGGGGNDTLNGGNNDDALYGDNGNDIFLSSTGYDDVYGGAGKDTYDASGLFSAASVDLGTGLSIQGGYVTTLEAIENITGSLLNDSLTGDAAANVLNGNGGTDTLSGGLGNDTYYVDDAGDTITESSNASLGGNDTVNAAISYTLANYTEVLNLTGSGHIDGNGNSRDNTLNGNAGNNLLDGKAGNDYMAGGLGDDTYWVDASGDTVIEVAGQGNDTIRSAISYALVDTVENLVLTGAGDLNGTGNASINSLTGNTGANNLNGGSGADIMAGGTGDDTYYVDNAGDNVVEADGAGNDTIIATVSYTLSGRFVETLSLSGGANINATGNSRANVLISNTGNNSLSGGGGADLFVFSAGSHADTITDFNSGQGDSINATAYHAVSHTVIQNGTSVLIDFGGGNTVTVLNAVAADVTAHTIF